MWTQFYLYDSDNAAYNDCALVNAERARADEHFCGMHCQRRSSFAFSIDRSS